MRRSVFLIPCLLLLVGLPVVQAAAGFPADTREPLRPLKTVPSFELPEPSGKTWSLKDLADRKAIVVVFLGTECPVNNAYLPRLAELHKEFGPKGVQFLAINSNSLDTSTRILGHAKANGIPFPVLKDSGNKVADEFAAERTPEAFVLTPAGKTLYRGRIDDQIGIGFKRKQPGRRDLVLALEEVLAGKAVSVPRTEAPGCLISRAIKPSAKGTVTYTKHVSRILQKNCQECHRPEQVGPMPLLTHEDAVAWSGMIQEVVSEGRMPPWHADPKHGRFANDRSLSSTDRETLLNWIKQGCPQGDAKDAPPPRTFASGWRIGKPDVVVEMPTSFTVPAEGGSRGIRYQFFVAPTEFKEDRWIQAAEVRPGAREVVHHIIIYVVDKARMKRDRGTEGRGDGIGNGFLAAYAPGDMPLMLEPGQAKKLPKGSVLVFQVHYTPDGVERTDRSSVGLIFAKEPPRTQVRTRGIAQQALLILPGAKNYEAKSSTTFTQDAELLSFLPHMHLRGKDFLYEVVYPDGKRQTLLSVPKYDFNWQSNYRLEKPLHLPAGTKIVCTAHFDNSAGNPNNPNPKAMVTWGDQTWEEMMIGFVDYANLERPKQPDSNPKR